MKASKVAGVMMIHDNTNRSVNIIIVGASLENSLGKEPSVVNIIILGWMHWCVLWKKYMANRGKNSV